MFDTASSSSCRLESPVELGETSSEKFSSLQDPSGDSRNGTRCVCKALYSREVKNNLMKHDAVWILFLWKPGLRHTHIRLFAVLISLLASQRSFQVVDLREIISIPLVSLGRASLTHCRFLDENTSGDGLLKPLDKIRLDQFRM
jgi:hypothetical protein